MISSHLLDELGKIATNYGIVANGKLVEEITSFELEQKCRTSLMLSVDKPALAKEILGRFWDGISIEEQGGELRVSPIPQDSSEINRLLVEQGVRVYELKNESIGFEDFFLERIG